MSSSRAITLLTLLLGCRGTPDDPVGLDQNPARSDYDIDQATPGPDLTIQSRGPAGAIPQEIVVRSREPLFAEKLVGREPPKGTVLELVPAVEGQLMVQDQWTLVFTPDTPFTPDTNYKVTLKSLDSGDPAVVPPESAVGLSHSFQTPGFDYSSARLMDWDRKKKTARFVLSWTGPVDIPSGVTAKLDGIPVTAKISPGSQSYEAILTIEDPFFAQEKPPQSVLSLEIPATALAGTSVKAGRTTDRVTVNFGAPPLKIESVRAREGGSGFYVNVVCDDGAVPEKFWWWDRQDWDEYKVSTRCMLDAASLGSHLHIEPAVEVEVAPSEAGFRLFGDFVPGTSYRFAIDGGATTEDGGTLIRRYETTLDIPHKTPKIQFAAKGRYLPRNAWKNLPIVHTNVERVRLSVRHIPEENLVFWLSGEEGASSRTANLILQKELDLPAPLDTQATSYVDVGAMVPEAGNGVYEIFLERIDKAQAEGAPAAEEEDQGDTGSPSDSPDSWRRVDARAAARLLRTDIQLIARTADPGPGDKFTPAVEVWAIDTHTNKPLADTMVKLVRPSGFTVSTCKTGADGHCRMEVPQDGSDPTAPFALIATRGSDLTYLRFSDLRTPISGDVSGLPYKTTTPYRAAPYLDRGVYRPGDTAHLSAVIRTDNNEAPPSEVPVLVKVQDPQGRIVRQKVITPNTAGLLTLDVPFSTSATTGRWYATLEVAKNEIGRISFQVEEFVPERLRVKASPSKADLKAGDPLMVDVDAAWLFGAPASNARTELDCRVEPSSFKVDSLPGFRFGPALLGDDTNNRTLTLGMNPGELDANGKGQLACPTSKAVSGLTIPSELVATASVFEGDSGRTTVNQATAKIHPESYYIGLKTSTEKVKAQTPVQLEGVLVDWNGKAMADDKEVQLEFYRLEEESFWTWDEDAYQGVYRRYLRRARVQLPQTVKTSGGKLSFSVTPPDDTAAYLVVATSGRARTEYYLPGATRWWWWSFDETVDETPRPEAPKPLAISVPEKVRVGEKVQVKVNAPFAGRILYTVETDRVQQYAWADAVAGENTWEFPVSSFTPNVYVSAFIAKDPHLESASAFVPDRAFGVKSVAIEPTKFLTDVRLSVPEEVRPWSTLEVGVDLGKLTEPTFVTLAAVDAGILSLTKFADPDPAPALWQRRAWGLEAYETIGWTLLFAPGTSGKKTGGDAEAGLGRIQMVKPVSLWSGPVEVPTSGKATVKLEIPGYRGELRVMAVATGKTKTGAAATSVKVREPLVLQTTLPRFLLQGDVADVPVQISNQSGSAQKVKVEAEVESINGGKLEVKGGGTLDLAKDASGSVRLSLKGLSATGGARITIKATSGTLVSKEILEIPLQPPTAPAREVAQVKLPVGNQDLKAGLDRWIAGTDEEKYWVTTNPYAPALSSLDYVIHYPYGCIEQTTSAIRPLLYVGGLLDRLTSNTTRKVEDMVQSGLERVAGMQTASGGFSYWPGGSEATPWGTVYATHALLDAKEAGYPVNEEVLRDALVYLERIVDASSSKGTSELAYSHYILARAGKGRSAQAAAALESVGTGASANEQRYLLQAAMFLSGDRRHEKALRKLDTSAILLRRYNDWAFYSDLRERGLQLSVFRDLFKDDPGGDGLASVVAAAISRMPAWRYTTQEIAWATTALGKSLPKPVTYTAPQLLVNGKAQTASVGKGTPDYSWTIVNAALSQSVQLQVPDNANNGLYLVSTVSGNLVQDDRPIGGEGLSVEREFLDASGEPWSGEVKVGDLVYVRVHIKNTSAFSVQNLALTDRVPAGWEIENPRLGRGGTPDWQETGDLWSTDYIDVRDDRVSFFGTLSTNEKADVIYLVRAVTEGVFSMPGTTLEAMYDPTLWARSARGTAEVLKR